MAELLACISKVPGSISRSEKKKSMIKSHKMKKKQLETSYRNQYISTLGKCIHPALLTIFYTVRTKNGSLSQFHLQTEALS